MKLTQRCYIFDIDGTLSDPTHRLHFIQKDPKDWDGFFDACADDPPIPHMVQLAKDLGIFEEVVFVSGRPDRVRAATELWLEEQGLDSTNLFMRKDGDHRPDDIVKGELLDAILTEGFAPIMAFDDRTRVVEMWRHRGIPCAQVADGDF